MRFICECRCYFKGNLWDEGDVVDGEFAVNKHFRPVDQEAVEAVRAAGREVEDLADSEPAPFEPDPTLMARPVHELRAMFPGVEWKANMRKPEFVKSIMEANDGN